MRGPPAVETKLRDSNHQIVALLTKEAGDAKQSALDAANAALLARTASVAANGKSNEVKTSASTALTLSRGARSEADSFEKDIVSAKAQAAEAESHLADALQQAAAATNELNRLKTPRSLTNSSTLVPSLKEFKGTQYTFTGVFQDLESINLLKEIDDALQNAGWTRTKLPPNNGFGDIEINIFKDFGVPPTALSGVFVETRSPEKLESLQALPMSLLPQYHRAALALKSGLASGISPTQEDLRKSLAVLPGDSKPVFILVGKRP